MNFSLDGHTMITRGGDDTLKGILLFLFLLELANSQLVWDLRNLAKGAVSEVTKLPNYFAQTDCIFSPDERYIVTGMTSIAPPFFSLLLPHHEATTNFLFYFLFVFFFA